MEPLKALTLIVVAGTISLVGAGAAGFYVGYTSGRGNLDDIKAHLSGIPVGATASSAASAVSLKPVLEDIRALSKQVETLAATSKPASDPAANLKSVLDEIRALPRQQEAKPQNGSSPPPPPKVIDHSGDLNDIRSEIKALVAKIDKQEPKAPKALIDEIRSLSASVQAQEPSARRAVAEEIRNAMSTAQAGEQRLPKAVIDEIKAISASVKAQEARVQPSVTDQFKVLNASIDGLRTKLPDQLAEDMRKITTQLQALAERMPATGPVQGKSDAAFTAEVAQLRQLVASASEQFGKCQSQLATITTAALTSPQSAPVGTSPVAVSQTPRQEPSTVVFYDNVMLKKDQEKQYEEIGVRLSLQAVTPRQVRVAVNRQGFGLSFGERKVFRSQDVECELNLMETNLNDAQARVSISCKR